MWKWPLQSRYQMPMWIPAAPQTQRMKKKKRLVWLLTLWIHCCCSSRLRLPWALLSSSLIPSKQNISSWTYPAITVTCRCKSVGGYLLEDGSFVQVGGLAALEDLVLHIHSNRQEITAESRHRTQLWAKCLQIGTQLLTDVYSVGLCAYGNVSPAPLWPYRASCKRLRQCSLA